MTTGKEKARRLARGQGQAIAHFRAQFGAQLVVQFSAQFTRRRAMRYVAQHDGVVLPAAARRPEPLKLGSTGRSAG